MPPINGVATAGVIAVSVAVAAAIAIYESPELQRLASDLRRRIAIALHNFGDTISPEERANLFNRPEDAEAFLASRGLGRESAPPGVDADPESLRRQREELMYWNALREAKKEKERKEESEVSEKSEKKGHRARASSSFDDFLRPDGSEKGAFVFHQSGHEAHDNNEGLLTRRRGTDGLRGLNHFIYTNPFADEHGIEDDIAFENSLMEPEKDEMSDIYSATDLGAPEPYWTIHAALQPEVAPTESLPEYSETQETKVQEPETEAPSTPQTLGREPELSEYGMGPDEYMTAGQDTENEGHDAFNSIQAWAQSASHNASFYSPLPASTAAPSVADDIDIVSDASFMTPADTASVADSGVEVAAEEVESHRSFDVLSDEDEAGVLTPTSWSDVESIVSESETGRQAVHS
ncbi:hypothetical protein F5Y17DRAFT_169206 [Xylariaceae sp. FL0594]|nr:hypothetical protein F5Y17DRAFT_169206 [Xylariaceae sp. FL0594]